MAVVWSSETIISLRVMSLVESQWYIVKDAGNLHNTLLTVISLIHEGGKKKICFISNSVDTNICFIEYAKSSNINIDSNITFCTPTDNQKCTDYDDYDYVVLYAIQTMSKQEVTRLVDKINKPLIVGCPASVSNIVISFLSTLTSKKLVVYDTDVILRDYLKSIASNITGSRSELASPVPTYFVFGINVASNLRSGMRMDQVLYNSVMTMNMWQARTDLLRTLAERHKFNFTIDYINKGVRLYVPDIGIMLIESKVSTSMFVMRYSAISAAFPSLLDKKLSLVGCTVSFKRTTRMMTFIPYTAENDDTLNTLMKELMNAYANINIPHMILVSIMQGLNEMRGLIPDPRFSWKHNYIVTPSYVIDVGTIGVA